MEHLSPRHAKAVLLIQWGRLPLDARGKKVGVAALEAEFDLARGYISKYLLPHIESLNEGDAPLQVQHLRPEGIGLLASKGHLLEEQGEKWEGDFSWQEMATAVAATVAEHFELEVDLSGRSLR